MPERRSEATAGELRNPITFVKSDRAPDGATGFSQTFTRYAKGWAKIRLGPRKIQGGENADDLVTHGFLVRYAGFEPERGSFISWGTGLYMVRSSEIRGYSQQFLMIETNEHASTSGGPFIIQDPPEYEGGETTSPATIAPEPVAPPAPDGSRGDGDFWGLGEEG